MCWHISYLKEPRLSISAANPNTLPPTPTPAKTPPESRRNRGGGGERPGRQLTSIQRLQLLDNLVSHQLANVRLGDPSNRWAVGFYQALQGVL